MANGNIIIVGAGMGGLAAALSLQKAGVNVNLYEQAPQLGDVGAGLSISANASHALNFLGLGDKLEELGSHSDNSTLRHYRTNEVLSRLSIGSSEEQVKRFGNQFYQIHRADLHEMLSDAVRANDADCIKLGHEFESYEQDGSKVVVRFANGASVEGDALIGCDGAKSHIRSSGFSEEPPQFAGYVAYRGLVPVDALDPSIVRSGATLSIGPGQMFMRYTVRHKELLNFVGMVTTSDWTEEGWTIPSGVPEVLAHFDEWHDEVKTIIRATPEGAGFKWALVHRAPLASWVQDRVALLGDAAHTITPFLGQGAAMALEDGVVLGRCFADANTVEDALGLYDRTRVERGNWILVESQRQGDRYMKSDPENYDMKTSREVHAKAYLYDPATVPLPT